MVALQLGKSIVSTGTESRAQARGLPTGPSEIGSRVVTAVDENSTSLDTVDDLLTGIEVLRPYAGGQAIVGVIDQSDSLIVAGNLHDWHDGAECLFLHGDHAVVDVGQNNRGKPIALCGSLFQGEGCVLWGRVDGTLGKSIFDVRLDLLLAGVRDNGTDIAVGACWVAKFVTIKSY